jgi:PAS domain S-box-containing protein
MHATTRVDCHCHSNYSDGTLSPRDLAEELAAAGVIAAALTDHNTLEGLEEFRQTLTRREVGCIPAVEITTRYGDREAHLLAYGIDPAHPELQAALAALRQAHAPSVQSVTDSLRNKGTLASATAGNPLTNGALDIVDAIALVHHAGGRAFLAHPLVLEADYAKLESLVAALALQGLDGIEAFYGPIPDEARLHLCGIAQRLDLLVSAGTDIHDRPTPPATAGIDMPTPAWKAFRDAVCHGTALSSRSVPPSPPRLRTHFKRRAFIFHIICPTLLAMALFITAIYAVFLPTFERSLLERKRETIRELTQSAWSILAGFERDERAGRLTRAQAQALAISRIESLRYGRDSKDYFWLQDMHPRMLMHPYLKKLNGQDVSAFRDPRGVAIFVEFAALVQRQQEGYAQYVWQWNDDPSRVVPKESYLKGFHPWGWIIGTGIYIEDVKGEIARIERSLVHTSLLISIIVVLLLLYVMFESLRLERERAEAEESLHESTERYRSLVEATTEGTLVIMDGRCRYANPIFLEMLGCTARELELLDLADLFPERPDNDAAWTRLKMLLRGEDTTGGFDALLRRRDGRLLEVVLTPSPITFAGRAGFILLTRSIGASPDGSAGSARWQHLPQVIESSPVGLFRARATSRGTLVEYNRTAAHLLAPPSLADGTALALADLFPDATTYEDFHHDLTREGKATVRLHLSGQDLSRRTVALLATLVRDAHGAPRYIDGVVEDVTLQNRREADFTADIERLQTSLLFLHEPVGRIKRHAVVCGLETPIQTVAALMTTHQASAALVQAPAGAIVGIVTDGAIRQRVVATGMDGQAPIYRIMSSPMITISERAVIYEALLRMEHQQIQHLALTDEAGRIVGVIRSQELMQFQSYGPIVLTREVEHAATPEDVVRSCQRVPSLVKALLDCGARPHLITRMISSVCNAATVRLLTLAEVELGPAPVPFVFLALGSQGRQEMTLASDQDNAIVSAAVDDPARAAASAEYLLAVSRFVCGWLDRAGYPLCRGEVMAQNPRWCQPLNVWQGYFTDWIARAEPQQLLDFTIFFDFQPLYGPPELAETLRRHVVEQLRARPAFFPLFAHNSLLFKPPTRPFGRLLGGGGGDQAGLVDLKDALMPIVSFARLYALQHEVAATHTLERLKVLAEAEVFPESTYQAVTEAADFLSRLRLQHQAAASAVGQVPDNLLNPRRLSAVDQTLLQQTFMQIAAVQKRISFDFLGGT